MNRRLVRALAEDRLIIRHELELLADPATTEEEASTAIATIRQASAHMRMAATWLGVVEAPARLTHAQGALVERYLGGDQ